MTERWDTWKAAKWGAAIGTVSMLVPTCVAILVTPHMTRAVPPSLGFYHSDAFVWLAGALYLGPTWGAASFSLAAWLRNHIVKLGKAM